MLNKLNLLCVILLTCILMLFSCSQDTNQNSVNKNNNILSSNSDITSQSFENTSMSSELISSIESEEQLTKIPKEDYAGECKFNGKNSLTNYQLLFIQNIVNSLNEANIIYGFNNIDDIVTADFPTYLGFRSKYYSDIMLDKELNVHLDYNQILSILKGDFGINKAPLWLEEKGEIKAPFSSQGNPSEILSIDQNGNIATVIAKMYPTVSHDSSQKEDLPNTVKYTFELNEDGTLFLKSGIIIKY